MKKIFCFLMISIALLAGCKSSKDSQASSKDKKGMNKTEKGAVIGATSGAVVGGIIGNKSKNTALGAILGAAAGGAVGAVIGNKMDKQAKEMEKDLGETATVERVGEGIKITFNSQLLFDFGEASLRNSNKDDLAKFAKTLKEYPETDLLVVGHTDNVGSDAFNQDLSEKRAMAVSNQLTFEGVSSSRVKINGMGESQPVGSNESEEGRAQNRRVEIAVYANEKMKEEAKKETNQ